MYFYFWIPIKVYLERSRKAGMSKCNYFKKYFTKHYCNPDPEYSGGSNNILLNKQIATSPEVSEHLTMTVISNSWHVVCFSSGNRVYENRLFKTI